MKYDDFLKKVAEAETSTDAVDIWRDFKDNGLDCPATKDEAVDLWRQERDEWEPGLSL